VKKVEIVNIEITTKIVNNLIIQMNHFPEDIQNTFQKIFEIIDLEF
jgi:hypothetical protein